MDTVQIVEKGSMLVFYFPGQIQNVPPQIEGEKIHDCV